MQTTPAALNVPELADEPGLVHGFSTLALGSVGLTHAPDPAPVLAARRAFAGVLGLEGAELTTVGSVHGAAVARVDEPVDSVDDVDALVTDQPGVALFATYADCYPIVLWDPEKKVAGLVHAAANRAQLVDAGVKSVYEIGICTKEHYLFPSHRRHPDGKRFGAIVAVR